MIASFFHIILARMMNLELPYSKSLFQELPNDAKTSILVAGPEELRAQSRKLKMISDVGIGEPRVLTILLLWYLFSGVTLFLNKHFLTMVSNGSMLLGIVQVLLTTVCSFAQLYFPCGMWIATKQQRPPMFLLKNLFLVGIFRFLTIWFGLIALDYVAVSFAETVKCSAPIFTVVISRLITGEPSTLPVILSLIPIMSGLALCSAHELSFNPTGFLAALVTNISECLQSVYSKVLVSGEKTRCNPAELQFYSGAASVIVVIPVMYFFPAKSSVFSLDLTSLLWLILSGLSFHFQSITANVLMGFLSPTTYSVSNTVKRALLIWCSTLVYQNPVTLEAWFGTFLILFGILLYNRAKNAVIVAISTSD